ncbi:MAG: gluconolaconase [Acidobacteriota bacterium]
MKVKEIRPRAAVPGGIIRVEVEGLSGVADLRVEVGEVEAQFLGASPNALTLKVPESASGNGLVVYQGQNRARSSMKVARLVAQELYSVSNPVVDDRGSVYCAFSGPRGEKVPFSVYVIDPEGNKQPFLAEIVNATGLAIGPDRLLYITSRHTGTVYRSSFDKQLEKYIEGLGLATGIAFDLDGNMVLGDRGGTVYRISPDRQISVLCELEPSVSAYHLATAPDGSIFISGPTLSTQDSIYRVSRDGQVEVFFKGLGRPQGMAFDADGNLQVAASFQGKKGIYTFKGKSPEWTISGPMLTGLAYTPAKDRLYMVDSSNLYALDLAGPSASL